MKNVSIHGTLITRKKFLLINPSPHFDPYIRQFVFLHFSSSREIIIFTPFSTLNFSVREMHMFIRDGCYVFRKEFVKEC